MIPEDTSSHVLLEGVWAKIDRANMHIDSLGHEIDKWVERQPDRALRETNAEGTRHRFALDLSDLPTVNWGIIIGDCLHNLRSALNHLACALVIVNGKRGCTKDTEFPVFREADAWDTRKAGARKTKGMSDDARDLIIGVQPYARSDTPDNDPLWVLHDLNNADKHRVVVPAISAIHHFEIEAPRGGGHFMFTEGSLQHEDLFLTVYSNNPTFDYHPNLNAAFQISLNAPGFPELGGALRELGEETLRIVHRFVKFFE
jgi:hypothetical protein